jgi:hypothetical protein
VIGLFLPLHLYSQQLLCNIKLEKINTKTALNVLQSVYLLVSCDRVIPRNISLLHIVLTLVINRLTLSPKQLHADLFAKTATVNDRPTGEPFG